MKSFKTIVSEARAPYEVYHDSYTSAIQAVEKFVFKKKLFLDPEEMAQEIGMGPSKPGSGKTNRFTLRLYKTQKALDDMKPLRKAVHFQVYGMGNIESPSATRYELNLYIS